MRGTSSIIAFLVGSLLLCSCVQTRYQREFYEHNGTQPMVEVIYFDREMAHHVKRVLPSVWVRQSDYAIGVEPKQKARAIALLRKDAEEHHHSFQFVQGPDNGYGLNSMVVIAYGDEWAARDASAVLIGIPSFIGRLSSSCTIAVMPKQKNEVIELLQKDAAENHYSIQIVQ